MPALIDGEEGGSATIRALDLAGVLPSYREVTSEGWRDPVTFEVGAAAQGFESLSSSDRRGGADTAEAIGRAEPHPEIAMKDQAERFPTVVASHGFNMRQTSFLAQHLRSPLPRYSKATLKLSAGSLIVPFFETGRRNELASGPQ